MFGRDTACPISFGLKDDDSDLKTDKYNLTWRETNIISLGEKQILYHLERNKGGLPRRREALSQATTRRWARRRLASAIFLIFDGWHNSYSAQSSHFWGLWPKHWWRGVPIKKSSLHLGSALVRTEWPCVCAAYHLCPLTMRCKEYK